MVLIISYYSAFTTVYSSGFYWAQLPLGAARQPIYRIAADVNSCAGQNILILNSR